MPEAVLDEDLVEGIKQAKKSPRNFALIVKGASPVKLLVKKKKFRDAELMKAKTEAKGNDIITGVLVASGSDFAFHVVATAEPSVKTMKIKELISEQAEVTAKPRWELVKELPEVSDDDDTDNNDSDKNQPAASSSQASEVPNAPPPPPAPPAANANQLLAAMNKLSPQVQAAAKSYPDRKNDLVQLVAAFQQQAKGEQLDQARETLAQLVALLKTLPPVAPPANPTGKVSLVKLGKARLEWVGVRDAALADLRKLQNAISEEFADDAEQAQPLKNALATLGQGIAELEATLPEQLDEVLNADESNRPPLVAAARQTLTRLTSYMNTDPIMSEIDSNEVVPDMRVIAPVLAKLAEISAALG
jgi:hypothetical protein